MREKSTLWLVGGFLFCPCHFPLTLAVLGAALGGTALGLIVHEHPVRVVMALSVVWLLATSRGLWLLRNRCALILILLAGLGSRTAMAQGSPAATEDSVRAAEALRRQALISADTVALSRLVAAEFMEVSRLGQLRTRAENLQEIATGDLKLITVKYDSLVVHVYGDVALLRGIADNSGTYHGYAFGGKIRYTRVFVRRDGRWQAVSMQQTSMP